MTAPLSTAVELLEALRAGRASSVELVRQALARHAAFQPQFNALASIDEAAALAAARRADERRCMGADLGVLHGLPITIKDAFEVAGFPAVNGAPALRGYRPAQHAMAVQRLVDAGAIVLGKSNVPLYSLDLQTFNDVSGVTRNPWDPVRTPGGSGGGAAVALATGVAALELGHDLSGSLRLPAHCTGVCALKPSSGLVPTHGVLWPDAARARRPDLLSVGPMARSVADLRLMFDVLAGPAADEAVAWRLALPAPAEPATGLRVAAWLDEAICPVDPAVSVVLADTCRALEAAGIAVDRQARPAFESPAYFRDFFTLMYGEMSGGFSDPVYRTFAQAARRGADGEWTPLSAMPPAVTQSHRDWLAASERRARLREPWSDFFKRFDVLVTPVSPLPAQLHDQQPFEARSIRLGGRDWPYMQQAFWCALPTLAGLPAVVVPVGLCAEGLPVGIQIIAPYLADHTALAMAQLIERLRGGFVPPPGIA